MKKCFVNRNQAIITNHQSTEVAEPGEGTFDDPASSIATQRITVVTAVADEALWFLTGPPTAATASHVDRAERVFGQSRFMRGSRIKLLSQRNTLAVDHHHPLRALAPLGFSDLRAPFLAGAKLPSRNDSLQSRCSRSFSSAKKARQMVSQICCLSQSRSRRQHVAGEGNSSGKSC